MNKHFIAILGMLAGILSATAGAAPGEYWEITSKMEMPGMPFAMPGSTQKVCISKGGQNDPKKTSGDKDCQMTDIKTVGNKTTWKARCDHNGEVMTGTGEQTTSADGYQGKMKFAGKSHGQDMNMSMAFSGKRVGGSCDSEEAVKKMKAQVCDTSRFHSTADWIQSADMMLQPSAPCADQRKQLCELVLKDTPKDVHAYNALLTHDQQMGSKISVARECKLDMTATTKSICKTLNDQNYSLLSASCPAEAKAFRENERRRQCEGRSYTAETKAADFKKCMKGNTSQDDSADDSSQGKSSASHKAGKSDDNPASDILQNAKKLKGVFGF